MGVRSRVKVTEPKWNHLAGFLIIIFIFDLTPSRALRSTVGNGSVQTDPLPAVVRPCALLLAVPSLYHTECPPRARLQLTLPRPFSSC